MQYIMPTGNVMPKGGRGLADNEGGTPILESDREFPHI